MPKGDPEADDPHMLVGVGLPADETATREMAAAFADEFAQMGFDRERLLHLFSSPFYSGAHAARELLGDAEITRIVVESLRVYARQQRGVLDTGEDGDDREEPRGGGRPQPSGTGQPDRTIHEALRDGPHE